MLNTLFPPRIPRDVVERFAASQFALDGEWSPLDGERDQNFRIRTGAGTSWVMKVCNPDEGMEILACQAETLEHIARTDGDLPVPRLRRSLSGERLPVLEHGGRHYPVMVLSWLEGDVIGERKLPPAAHRDLGRLMARLGLAMRGFIHGAPAARDLVWDTRRASGLADQIVNLPEADRLLADDIITRHREVMEPLMRHMRSQIIHGDVHPYNSLAGADSRVCGIIDFGDMVHGPLILDLANATGDFLMEGQDNEAVIFNQVRGYCDVTRLEELEADALLDLIEVRLVMTPLIDALKLANGVRSQGYFETFNSRSMPMIRELRTIGRDRLRNLIRRAAGFGPASAVTENTGDLVARRRRVMGERLYVFYDPPVHMVKGQGVWLTSSDGRAYLDCYNNVPQVGHCHPYVTEAIVRQARTLNTNTRYITDQSVEYAERLAQLSSDGLSAVVFVNSGSEANDLAWRMAKAWTGKSGGLAMEFAYHGITDAIDAFSPSNAPESWNAPHIRLLPAPCAYRGLLGPDVTDVGERYAALADPLIAELDRAGIGVAAAMIDSAFMTNGILNAPQGYVQGIVQRVHAAGGLFIADEVQSGFGRMGTAFWGHRHHGIVPDFITIGKPAGNGHPVGAVITRHEILNHFIRTGPFFSTFGGNNVACAAGIAVLDVIRDESLIANAAAAGDYLREQLAGLAARHDLIGDVRGIGLATGVELVRNRETREPAGSETSRLLSLIRDEGVLIGGEGKFGNVLKIRPPLVFTTADADLAVAAISRALERL